MTIEPILHKKMFHELTTDELYELLMVRSEVFVDKRIKYDKSKKTTEWAAGYLCRGRHGGSDNSLALPRRLVSIVYI